MPNYVNFFPVALQPNSGLGRLHVTFRFTSVTRFRTAGRTPWTGDQVVARPLPVHKHRKTHTNTNTEHPCLSGIRTHGSGIHESEDSSCLRPLGYRNRQLHENTRMKVRILFILCTARGHPTLVTAEQWVLLCCSSYVSCRLIDSLFTMS
jgi:hypothetical protein